MLTKPKKRKKAKAKSRTIARPALSEQTRTNLKYIRTAVGTAVYVVAVLILSAFASVHIALGFYENPVQGPVSVTKIGSAGVPAPTGATVSPPARIKIPSIRVNAAIQQVGLTPKGAMGVPKLPRDAAWYMLGPKPGETGSAVIAGHLNWWSGALGVFERLKSVKTGDVITIQDAQGKNISFVVRETRAFGQKDDTTSVFRSTDGKSHLNLVTCAGTWDKKAGMYTKRLVVFADKVE